MITLQIEKKWFDMIKSGEKKEEYREVKPYYITRFLNLCKDCYQCYRLDCEARGRCQKICSIIEASKNKENDYYTIRFRNGYRKDSPVLFATCKIHIGKGKEEWGAKKGKEYFVLTILDIAPTQEGLKNRSAFLDLASYVNKQLSQHQEDVITVKKDLLEKLLLDANVKCNKCPIYCGNGKDKEECVDILVKYLECPEEKVDIARCCKCPLFRKKSCYGNETIKGCLETMSVNLIG